MKRSPLLSIFLIVLVDVLGMTIILPLLPFYAESLGASPVIVGLLVSTYAGCQLIGGPWLGHISDRIGRKPVLIVSQCGTFAGFVLLAFSNTLPLVFLSRAIDGLTAGNLSVAQAYIADVTDVEKRTQSFALIGIAFGLGFLVGPAVTAFLAVYSMKYPIFLAAGLSATSILATTFLLPRASPRVQTEQGKRASRWTETVNVFKDPKTARLMFQFSAFSFTFAMFMSGFALFSERRFMYRGEPFGTTEVGYVLAFLGLMGIIIQGSLIRRLVKRLGEAKLVGAGFLSLAISLSLLGVVREISGLLLVMAIFSFGAAVLRPALTTLITAAVGKGREGMGLGMTQSLMNVAQIAAPVIGGLMIARQQLALWAFSAAAFSIAGFLGARGTR